MAIFNTYSPGMVYDNSGDYVEKADAESLVEELKGEIQDLKLEISDLKEEIEDLRIEMSNET